MIVINIITVQSDIVFNGIVCVIAILCKEAAGVPLGAIAEVFTVIKSFPVAGQGVGGEGGERGMVRPTWRC